MNLPTFAELISTLVFGFASPLVFWVPTAVYRILKKVMTDDSPLSE